MHYKICIIDVAINLDVQLLRNSALFLWQHEDNFMTKYLSLKERISIYIYISLMEYVPALSDTCRTLVTQHFVIPIFIKVWPLIIIFKEGYFCVFI